MKKLTLTLFAAALLFGGCGTLAPKRVEFFQDEVEQVPEAKSSEKETQRQAADLAAKKAEETLLAAVSNQCPAEVVVPAKDSAVLTESVSVSLGPPSKPSTLPAQGLSQKLDKAVASLNRRMDEFREDNDKNEGKKIEGTGLFQVPYFMWLAIVAGLIFVAFIIFSIVWAGLKIYAMSNPPLAMGLSAVQLAGKTIGKGFTQIVRGGENFKETVKDKFVDAGRSAEVQQAAQEILELFRHEQQKSQDIDIQAAVQHLTK